MSNTNELQYSKDVLWVWEHVGTSLQDLRELDDVTPSRIVLYDWISTTEGRDALFKTILPKAQDALIKARASKDPDSIVDKETKSIASLKEFIKDVVSDALDEVKRREPSPGRDRGPI